MKLQKDCLVTLRPACQIYQLDQLWRHEDKGYVFNSLTRWDFEGKKMEQVCLSMEVPVFSFGQKRYDKII